MYNRIFIFPNFLYGYAFILYPIYPLAFIRIGISNETNTQIHDLNLPFSRFPHVNSLDKGRHRRSERIAFKTVHEQSFDFYP